MLCNPSNLTSEALETVAEIIYATGARVLGINTELAVYSVFEDVLDEDELREEVGF